jgi:hypothetical protein
MVAAAMVSVAAQGAEPETKTQPDRLRGNVGLHAIGGFGLLNAIPHGVVGAHLRARHGFWAAAQGEGLSSGLEVKLYATLVVMPVDRRYTLVNFEGGGEVRGWYRRVSLGVATAFDFLMTPGTCTPSCDGPNRQTSLVVGPSLSVAVLDDPKRLFIIGVRWIPAVFVADPLRFASELEIGFEWLSLTVVAGLKRELLGYDDGFAKTWLGFWVTAGIGGRLRW